MSKKRVCFISDSARCTHVGQSIVSYECLRRLAKDYDVCQIGFADAEIREPKQCNFEVIPALRSDMHDINKTTELVKKANPDVVIMSHDIWMLPVISELKARLPNPRYIGWITCDGEPQPYNFRPLYKAYDKLLAPTPFTKKVLLDRWCDLDIDVVPYGINHEIFHPPIQGKERLKYDLAKAHPQLGQWLNMSGRFVGIFIGANQDRKNLGLIHESWREFEKGKESTVMLMMFIHSASLSQEMGSYDLAIFLQDTKTLKIINTPQPDEIIGQFTAASDILIHPSSGEGFGLTVAQSMACGAVPVTIPYAAVGDYCNNENSYCIPYTLHTGGFHVHRALSDVNNVVAQLNQAYNHPTERATKASKGVEVAANFTWENTVEGLKKNIEDVSKITRNTLYFARIN